MVTQKVGAFRVVSVAFVIAGGLFTWVGLNRLNRLPGHCGTWREHFLRTFGEFRNWQRAQFTPCPRGTVSSWADAPAHGSMWRLNGGRKIWLQVAGALGKEKRSKYGITFLRS